MKPWPLTSIPLATLLIGCAQPVEYQAVPAWLIPPPPTVPTVSSAQLRCLTDESYGQLVRRDRLCWQYARELRALLGPEP